MTSAIQPYRQTARAITVKEANKPLYGLIRIPKPHHCGHPGFLRRVFMALILRPVRRKSVYRCRECMKVWELDKHGSDIWVLSWRPEDYRPDATWTNRGGALEIKLDEGDDE